MCSKYTVNPLFSYSEFFHCSLLCSKYTVKTLPKNLNFCVDSLFSLFSLTLLRSETLNNCEFN